MSLDSTQVSLYVPTPSALWPYKSYSSERIVCKFWKGAKLSTYGLAGQSYVMHKQWQRWERGRLALTFRTMSSWTSPLQNFLRGDFRGLYGGGPGDWGNSSLHWSVVVTKSLPGSLLVAPSADLLSLKEWLVLDVHFWEGCWKVLDVTSFVKRLLETLKVGLFEIIVPGVCCSLGEGNFLRDKCLAVAGVGWLGNPVEWLERVIECEGGLDAVRKGIACVSDLGVVVVVAWLLWLLVT